MKGINRALSDDVENVLEESKRFFSQINNTHVPCVFVSYQRDDEVYAKSVADYILSLQLDVYFDLKDKDLKIVNQLRDPKEVTNAIKKGLNQSDYMIVIVSPNTSKSPWVPFEVGYAYDNKGDRMKILRHKGIDKNKIPDYLKVKELLQGSASLDRFLDSVRKTSYIYESLQQKGEIIKTFSRYSENPLAKYLDNE